MVKTILITGASSGIGRALAISYAKKGIVLHLLGRSKERLNEVLKICIDKGAEVTIKSIDVKDDKAMAEYIESVKDLDLVIANAGISSGTSKGDEEFSVIKEVFDTNLFGVLNTVQPALKLFKKIGKGQIAIISSLASYRGMAGSPAYSASKAAVRVYGEALRDLYYKDNIKINIVCPGFVKSGITDKNNFKMPLLMEADKSAQIIKSGLEKNKAVIAFPFSMAFMAWLIGALPTAISSLIVRFLPKK